MLQRGRESRGAHNAVAAPIPRAGHVEAVALYEEGVAALQAHEFSRASALLRSVLSRYPEERELHERVRLYLNVCERHMAPRAASPVHAGRTRVRRDAGGQRRELRRGARASARPPARESPEHDHALYMLASVLALRDEVDEAVPLLLRAIELNPDNRSLARHDPDLDAAARSSTASARRSKRRPREGRAPQSPPPRAESTFRLRAALRRTVTVNCTPMSDLHVVILAAGKGTRMKSARPEGAAPRRRQADDRLRHGGRAIALAAHDDGRRRSYEGAAAPGARAVSRPVVRHAGAAAWHRPCSAADRRRSGAAKTASSCCSPATYRC